MTTELVITSKNSADIAALKDYLRGVEIGELTTYEQLTQVVGRDIRKHRYLLLQACNQLLSERNYTFGTVLRQGIKRLNADETVESSKHILSRIRGQCRRQARKLTSVDYATLSTDDLKRLHNGALSVFAAIAYSADSRNLHRLTESCQNHGPQTLPTAATLRLLAS